MVAKDMKCMANVSEMIYFMYGSHKFWHNLVYIIGCEQIIYNLCTSISLSQASQTPILVIEYRNARKLPSHYLWRHVLWQSFNCSASVKIISHKSVKQEQNLEEQDVWSLNKTRQFKLEL